MDLKKVDIKFGLLKENEHFEIIKSVFDTTLEKDNDKYNLFDYIGDECYIELKSRRNKHNTYPDTMVGYNKIEFAMRNNNNKKVIFCFSFTDGLFYYKFDKKDIINKSLRISSGGRCDRGYNEYKDYCYIPISMLKPICR